MDTFSEILKNLLNETHTSQKELADDLALTTASISRYCSGEQFPRSDVLRRIAEYFSVSVDYLIGMDSNRTKNTSALYEFIDSAPPVSTIIQLLQKLNPQELRAIYEYVGYMVRCDEMSYNPTKKEE